MLTKIWTVIASLVGNKGWAVGGIFAFIVILSLAFCHSARAGEIDLRAGSSFGTEGYGPVLGLQLKEPLAGFDQVNWFAGTLLWAKTRYNNAYVQSNWDWHTGLEGCHGAWCAGIGAVYLQRIDAINGAHTNFMLQLSYKIGWKRISSIDITHISDAGTTPVNIGRQALIGSFKLQ
jgi:hypothetical protein